MKSKRKPSAWNIHLMEVYHEMKDEDSTIKLKDAMVSANASYKKEE
ncbi:MAG: hypothetical protein GXO79_11440 [Chlorobi bacterium]|nr:hypothetical protein [Chlorobiota bacterium]